MIKMSQLLTVLSRPLFQTRVNLSSVPWQRVLEHFPVMKSIFSKIILLTRNGLTKESCVAAHLLSKRIYQLLRKQGFLGTTLYLKQCVSSLMIAYGGEKSHHSRHSSMVSLTRSGYPRIIPAFHRKMMMRGDDRADALVQMYLSFLSVYRIAKVAKKINKETFTSIVSPVKDIGEVLSFIGEIKPLIWPLVDRYAPAVRSTPLNQGVEWTPTWKSLPNTKLWRGMAFQSRKAGELSFNPSSVVSLFPVFSLELAAYGSLLEFIHSKGEQWSSGILWNHRVRFAGDPMNKIFSGLDLESFEKTVGPVLPTIRDFQLPIAMGRLSRVVEGGGKGRIFAIGNYVNQRLLHPVHTWWMSILRSLPGDGTFNQPKPLRRLIGATHVYSFDLSAATDRWPLVLLFETMGVLFDRSFASAVVNSALACNVFDVGFVRKRAAVCFVAGQPLGYYSSWPLFSFTHHLVIWMCAEKIYPGRRFDHYAVLGDDVVIADPQVAREYSLALSRLGVTISLSKSLCSDKGAGEFAKRFLVRKMSKDLSPVSSRLLLSAHHVYGAYAIAHKYPVGFKTLMRVNGAGYRQMGSMSHKLNRQHARLFKMYSRVSSQLPLDWWLGRGAPLNPYLFGFIVDYLFSHFKPKELKVAPDEVYRSTGEQDFLEWSALHRWVKMWCEYLRWYCKLKIADQIVLEDFFKAPIVNTSWKADQEDPVLVRFGLIWKLYDMVGQRGLWWRPPILPSREGDNPLWLLGGISGHDFLVLSDGLVQPKAGKGTIVYKTLGAPERTAHLDFVRRQRPKNQSPVREYSAKAGGVSKWND